MQTMVLPFTNSEGYILFYNRENEENLKGNIISIASGTNKNIKKDYFVTDVGRQTKLTPAQQQELGEQATEVKKELDGLNIILDERANNVIKEANPTETETLQNKYDTLNNHLHETPEIVVTLFSSDQLMVFFTEQMSKTQTSSNQIITGKQPLYDILYAYYQQKYDKLQERSENPEEDTKKKYPDFGEYLNGEYSNLFRKYLSTDF